MFGDVPDKVSLTYGSSRVNDFGSPSSHFYLKSGLVRGKGSCLKPSLWPVQGNLASAPTHGSVRWVAPCPGAKANTWSPLFTWSIWWASWGEHSISWVQYHPTPCLLDQPTTHVVIKCHVSLTSEHRLRGPRLCYNRSHLPVCLIRLISKTAMIELTSPIIRKENTS